MNYLRQYIRYLIKESSRSPKVIFMAGAPGSGKSTVIRKLGLMGKFKIVNPDDFYEADLKHHGIPFDQSKMFSDYKKAKINLEDATLAGDTEAINAATLEVEKIRSLLSQNMKLFNAARKKAKSLAMEFRDLNLDYLIDGTGGNYNEIAKQVRDLKGLGYNVSMIYIDVPLEISLERNRSRGERGGRRLGDYAVEKSWNSVNKNIEKFSELFGENFFHIDADPQEFETSFSLIKPNILNFIGSI